MPTSKSIVAEIVSKRTLNSKHYLLSDGSYQAVIHMGQIHFDDGEGNLHNINTDLFDEADFDSFEGPVNKHGKANFHAMKDKARSDKAANKLNRDNFDYQGLQVPFEAKIPRNIKRGYTIGKGTDKLTFKPVGASPAKGYVDADETNTIHYQDAWNDADVILELTDRGIKETITLKTDRAPSSFSFEVDGDMADDLTAGELALQPAWLEDAEGTKRDVSQTVRRENNKVYVDMAADISGLFYPIVIDPTVTISYSSEINDGYLQVNGANVSALNDMASIYLHDGISSGSIVEYDGLVKFDLSSIQKPCKVTSATLNIVVNAYTQTRAYNQQFIVTPSSMDTVTITTDNYGKRVSGHSDITIHNGSLSSGQTFGFDVTNSTDYSVNTQNLGYYLSISPYQSSIYEGDYIELIFYGLTNGTTSRRPTLSVTYNQSPTAPTVTSPNGGESWNSQQTVTWNDAKDNNDPIDTGLNAGFYSTGIVNNQYTKHGQQFMNVNDGYLDKLEFKLRNYTANSDFKIALYDTDTNGIATTLLNSEIVNFPTGTANALLNYTYEFVNKIHLSPNSKYIIAFEYISTALDIGLTNASTYGNGSAIYYDTNISAWSVEASDDLMFKITTYQTNLQYEIQLSTDNGGTWKDIIALTTAGATSYDYDFINETESSTCLIRVRAYDGSSYGPWDQSDGVFTIVHNQAPTAPTNLSPSGGTSKDRASVIRFAWQHNDPNSGDPQSQFDFQWRVKGNTTWNTVTRSTPNQFYDMPGGTLPHGDIEWQVRTYDQAGLSSPYSALVTFLAGDKPSAPTLTAPLDGDTVAVANPTVQWSSSGQTGFTLSVKDATATEVYSATGTTNKAHTVQYDLANQSTYTIYVTISNTDNLSSDPDNAGITVSYTPPADPILSTQIDSVRGSITVHIENPVPSGTEPNVSYNDIYRCKQGETDYIRIGVNIPNDGSFTDYTPASDQVYEYYVRVYGDNGTFNDSAIISDSVAVSDAQIALTTDYSQVANVVLNNQSGGPQRDFKHSVDRAMMTFAGREYPVAEFSEFDSLSAGLSFIVQTKADIDMLRKLAYSRQTLLYRDSRGRREFVTLDGLDESDIINGWYSVSVSPLRVSFSEVV